MKYPAIYYKEEKYINLQFIDLQEAYTFAENMKDLYAMAREVLELSLEGRIADLEKVPPPSEPDFIKRIYPDRDIIYIEENVLKKETFKTWDESSQKKLVENQKCYETLGAIEYVNVNDNYGLKYKKKYFFENMKIKVKAYGKTLKGTIRFGKYEDFENKYRGIHFGFYVEWNKQEDRENIRNDLLFFILLREVDFDSGIEYKGYSTTIYYSPEDRAFFGKLEDINDLVNFEASTIQKAKEEFKKAVDDYITFKKEVNK